jgi:hypothetical protein
VVSDHRGYVARPNKKGVLFHGAVRNLLSETGAAKWAEKLKS